MTSKEKCEELVQIANMCMSDLLKLNKIKLDKKEMALCVVLLNADAAEKIRRVLSEPTDNTGGVVVNVQGKQLPIETIEQIQKATKEAVERAKNGLAKTSHSVQ